MKTLLLTIKNKNLSEIKKYINEGFRIINSEKTEKEGCSTIYTHYEITPSLLLISDESIESYDSDVRRAYSLYVYNIQTSDKIFMYECFVGCINGIPTNKADVLLKDGDEEKLDLWLGIGSGYTQEAFESLASRSGEALLCACSYWTCLADDVRLEESVKELLLSTVYSIAETYYVILCDEDCDYLDICNEGPLSEGELFYNKMKAYEPFFNLSKEEFRDMVLSYIKKKNSKDLFLNTYTSYKELISDLYANRDVLPERLDSYINFGRKKYELEREYINAKEVYEFHDAELQDYLKMKEKMITECDKNYSVYERILLKLNGRSGDSIRVNVDNMITICQNELEKSKLRYEKLKQKLNKLDSSEDLKVKQWFELFKKELYPDEDIYVFFTDSSDLMSSGCYNKFIKIIEDKFKEINPVDGDGTWDEK